MLPENTPCCLLCFGPLPERPWDMQTSTRRADSENVGPFCSRACIDAFAAAMVEVGL